MATRNTSAYGADQCYASCPPSTVTIRPPPFVLTIPGPALYCPDQPMGIQQCNPCENVGGGGGMRIGGAYSGSGGSGEAVLAAIGNEDESSNLWRYPSWGGRPWGYRPNWGGRGPWGRPPWGGRRPWGGRGPWIGSCLDD